MLILTRRVGESIVIGSVVAVTVKKVEGGQVKLGILAPCEIPVHRTEVYERIVRGEPRKGGRP